jgi:hypothetical protein
MEARVFADVGKFIQETMTECEYAGRVGVQLEALEARYTAGVVTETELERLRNVGVLVQCALVDFGCGDERARRLSTAVDARCREREATAERLEADWAVVVGRAAEMCRGRETGGQEGERKRARGNGRRLEELLDQMAALVEEMRGGGGGDIVGR